MERLPGLQVRDLNVLHYGPLIFSFDERNAQKYHSIRPGNVATITKTDLLVVLQVLKTHFFAFN